ncbi:hypothetical protein ANO11243_060930 [Dothideomycetidae sp. 11243]|nr:hypothetical protein ANO11243_060930 [fungal sp. No.11243]
MDFQPLFKTSAKPNWEKSSGHNFIRAQFRIETFMVVGALIQAVLSTILPFRYAFVPAGFIAIVKLADMYAIKIGMKKNPHMEGVVFSKYSAQFPDRYGSFGNQPARDGMCVFIIGTRNNTAEGILNKKFKEVGEFMGRMQEQLKADPEKTGCLGSSAWLGTERASNSHTMLMMYFKSAAHVHEYAHSPLHREAWDWWYKHIDQLKEISIFHELYEVPSGNYENIYDHSPPMLASATTHKIYKKTERGEEVAWQSPAVDARKGLLKTSRGRMARSQGLENDKYGLNDEDVYESVTEKTLA